MVFTAPATGTLTQLEVQIAATAPKGRIRMGVYADSAGLPGALLIDAGDKLIASGWNAIPGLNLPVAEGTLYWLTFVLTPSTTTYYQPNRPANSHAYASSTYGPLPAAFPSIAGRNNNQLVMRATYIVGTPKPTPPP